MGGWCEVAMKMRFSFFVMLMIPAFACCGIKPDGAVIREAAELFHLEGKRVVVEGAMSREIWQHMISHPKGYTHESYVDIGRGQVVVYAKEKINCAGRIRIDGTVVKISGESKNPRRKGPYTEYHIAAESWRCLP
jgi:hypothetical protein